MKNILRVVCGLAIIIVISVSSLITVGLCLYIINLLATTILGWVVFGGIIIALTLYLSYLFGDFVFERLKDKRNEEKHERKYRTKKEFSEGLIDELRCKGYGGDCFTVEGSKIIIMDKTYVIEDEDVGSVFYLHRLIFKDETLSDEVYEISNYDDMFSQFDRYLLEIDLEKHITPKEYVEQEIEKRKDKCFKEYKHAFVNR